MSSSDSRGFKGNFDKYTIRLKEIEILLVYTAFNQRPLDRWLQKIEPEPVPKTVRCVEDLFYWVYSTILKKNSFSVYLYPNRDLILMSLGGTKYTIDSSTLINHKDFEKYCISSLLNRDLNKDINNE